MEVIIDRNEAFKHNSCKKLAQLGKVIFSLSSSEKDKIDEQNEIITENEEQVHEIFVRHNQQMDEIQKDLVRFRKSCIDKYCNEFGSYYKQLKSDYADLIQSQTQKLQNILDDLIKTKKDLIEMEKNASTQSKSISELAKKLTSDMKGKNKTNSKKDLNAATAKINGKTETLLANFEQKLKTMKTQHNAETKKIKIEINKLFKDSIVKHKDELISLYKQVFGLKSWVGNVRKDYNTMMAKHQKEYQSSVEFKTKILNETKAKCKDIKKQKDNLAAQESKNTKNRQNEILSLNKVLKSAKVNHASNLEKIDAQIVERKKQIQKVEERNINLTKNRESALNSITEDLLKEFEEEVNKMNSEKEKLANEINIIHQETQDIVKWTEKAVEESINNVKQRLAIFKRNSENNEQNNTDNFEQEKADLIKQMDEKIQFLQEAIDIRFGYKKNQQMKQKEFLEKSEKEMNETKEDHNNKVKDFINEMNKEVKDYQKITIDKQEQRENDIKAAQTRRRAERQKKIEDIQQINNKEINNKVQNILKEREEKVAQLNSEKCSIASLNGKEKEKTFLSNEISDFHHKKSMLEAKLNFTNERITKAKSEIEKNAQKFQNDVGNIDKLRRKLQRRIETEKRAVDDDFEMKIQFAQVELQKAIDNIAKLFDNDENQRGCEIIEAIRKVRELKNKNNDAIMKKTKELEDLKNKNKKEEEYYRQQLDKIKNGDDESELNAKIEAFKGKTQELLDGIQKEKEKEIEKIKTSFQNEINEINKNKSDIEFQINLKKKEFDEIKTSINNEITNALQIKEQKKEDILAEYNKKEEELAKKHTADIEKMNRRIEQSKRKLKEIRQEVDKKYAEITKDLNNITEEKLNNSWFNIQKDVKIAFTQSEQVEQKINDLMGKQIKAEKAIYDPPPRKEEQQKISELQTEIASKTAEIETKFNHLYLLLENGPDPNLVQKAINSKSLISKSPRVITKSLSTSRNLPSLPPLEGM